MDLIERSFRLEADEGLGAKPRPELIGPVLADLRATLQDSVRMGFLHSSRTPGRLPNALRRAADVRYLGHSGEGDGVTLLRFEVARFGSVARELFAQRLLWDDGPKPDETAFELFGAAVRDIGRQERESSRFDLGLLHRVERYERRLKRGLKRIGLPDVDLRGKVQIDEEVVRAAHALSDATPPTRRVRVAGRLDLLGVSQRVLKLQIDDRILATAVWNAEEPFTDLAPFLDRDVVIEGEAVFRPSGSLLRVDADAISLATANDSLFRKLPVPTSGRPVGGERFRATGGARPYAAIFGRISAEESEEEFIDAVQELS